MYKNFVQLGSVKNLVIKNFKMSQFSAKNYSQRSSQTNSNIPLDSEIERLVWIDMEMTGLDVSKDSILEIACIITDSDLNIIAEKPNIVIHQPQHILSTMNDWCIKQHAKTGLTEASLNSVTTVEEAENSLLGFVSQHITEKCSPLAGNSVYMDRLFLMKYMPKLNNYLHYRIIDVSSIKELCRRWNNPLYKSAPKKNFLHRADDDIRESIKELQYYRKCFMKTNIGS